MTATAPAKTGGGLAGHLMRLLLALAVLDGVAVSSGIFTGQPRGDASYAVYAFAGTAFTWFLAGRRSPLPGRPTALGWTVIVSTLAALHTQAAVAAVRLPAAWPVPPQLATVMAIPVVVACGLALLAMRRAE